MFIIIYTYTFKAFKPREPWVLPYPAQYLALTGAQFVFVDMKGGTKLKVKGEHVHISGWPTCQFLSSNTSNFPYSCCFPGGGGVLKRSSVGRPLPGLTE